MDLVADIKALHRSRDEHLAAVREIDLQLANARRVLGLGDEPVEVTVRSSGSAPRTRTPWSGERSGTRDAVLAALALREPQTVKELISSTGASTVPILITKLWLKGDVFRAKRADSGKAYYYARSEAALHGYEHDDGTGGDVDPISPSIDKVVDGIGLATGTNGIAPTTSVCLETSELSKNGSGHA